MALEKEQIPYPILEEYQPSDFQKQYTEQTEWDEAKYNTTTKKKLKKEKIMK